ncbi:MAG: stage III sporulation protein AD, partial [Oscillospiraceae bacterium]|nr:stage III sporulation protein AD [Oscillospiraceae bacterium]
TQTASAVCQDAGQSALAKLLELGGGLLCLVAALPLLEAVLDLLEDLL